MDAKKMLQQYHARIKKENMLNSLLWSCAVGFVAVIACATTMLVMDVSGIWLLLNLAAFALVTAIALPIFYFTKFRPSIKQTAQRVDSMGLEERLLTMVELENDTSFISMKQREDAADALRKFNSRALRFVASTALIITLAITAVFGTGMVTIAALVDLDDMSESTTWHTITYRVQGEGTVINFTDNEEIATQKVADGEMATPVMAIANEEWAFLYWSDGEGNPYRLDEVVTESMNLIAVFEHMEAIEDDMDLDKSNNSNNQSEQSGNPGPPQPGNNGGGGKFEDTDTYRDGKTDYRGNPYDNAANEASQNADKVGDSDLIGDYFDIIKKP